MGDDTRRRGRKKRVGRIWHKMEKWRGGGWWGGRTGGENREGRGGKGRERGRGGTEGREVREKGERGGERERKKDGRKWREK